MSAEIGYEENQTPNMSCNAIRTKYFAVGYAQWIFTNYYDMVIFR